MASPSEIRIGVVGLGHMGDAFAENLLADGYGITVYDLDAERVQALADIGAQAAHGLADMAGCDLVLTSLPDDAALRSVTLGDGGLTSVMTKDTVHVALRYPSVRACPARWQKPIVPGGSATWRRPCWAIRTSRIDASFFVLAAGAHDDVARARPVLERLGQKLFIVGEDPALANVMKLAGNVLTAATLQSMGEVLALARKAGIDARTAYDVLTGSLFDGKVHKSYGGKIVQETYSPAGLTVPLAVKDLRLALQEAEAIHVPMPVASVAHDRLVAAEARGWAALDWSVLGKLAAADAGLEG